MSSPAHRCSRSRRASLCRRRTTRSRAEAGDVRQFQHHHRGGGDRASRTAKRDRLRRHHGPRVGRGRRRNDCCAFGARRANCRWYGATRREGRDERCTCHRPRHRQRLSEPGRGMRCLVVEDEADTAGYICNGLEEAGHTATLVRDGVNGLHLATNERWDIIILDRMLPGGVDGLSIIATIRSLGKTTPVIILSALASLDERVRGLRGGGDDYLTKPFAFSELLARIEALLRRGATKEDSRGLWGADLKLGLRTRRAVRSRRPIALQPRELRLLAYLGRRQGQ